MNPEPTIDAVSEAMGSFAVGDVREGLHAIQAAQNALDAAKTQLLVELDASKDFELDGASTLNMWVRNQLRMNAGQANALVRNMIVLRDLPLVGEVALSGQISAAHVQAFVYGLRHVGLEPMIATCQQSSRPNGPKGRHLRSPEALPFAYFSWRFSRL